MTAVPCKAAAGRTTGPGDELGATSVLDTGPSATSHPTKASQSGRTQDKRADVTAELQDQ